MRNIELKARLADLDGATRIAQGLCGAPSMEMRQVDTYFVVGTGRLKLREISSVDGSNSELIYYVRPNTPGARRCDYEISPVDDPAGLKRTLAAALGVRSTVAKQRTVYLWKNVRIHLDRVEQLGTFIEFEAVMSEDATDAEGEALNAELRDRFNLSDADIIDCSYVDLVEGE